jgi:hypothetical protein
LTGSAKITRLKTETMPNLVNNTLTIFCSDDEIMKKIKEKIFTIDENNNRIYTMRKLLPRPPEFAASVGDYEYGHFWSMAVWEAKWDANNCNITDSGDTITISYQTAWEPNEYWVELLCDYIQESVNHFEIDPPYVTVELKYTELKGDYGGIFDWVAWNNPVTQRYPLRLYAQLYDKPLYECILEYEELCKSVGIPIQPSEDTQPSKYNIDDIEKYDDYEDLPWET